MTDNLHNSTELTSNEKIDPIEIEHYSQSLAAFYNSSLEIEKTYIVLSSAAIAFISQLNLIKTTYYQL